MLQGGHERLTDRQTDGQTDRYGESNIPPNFVAGGITIYPPNFIAGGIMMAISHILIHPLFVGESISRTLSDYVKK